MHRSRGLGLAVFVAGVIALSGRAPAAEVAPAPLEAFGALPSFGHVGLSPSGRMIAYLQKQGGDRLIVVRERAGAPKVKLKIGSAVLSQLEWVDDDHLLVFIRGTNKTNDPKDKFLIEGAACLDLKKGRLYRLTYALHAYAGWARANGRPYVMFYNFTAGKFQSMPLDGGNIVDVAPLQSRVELSWLVDRQTGDLIALEDYVPETGRWTAYAGRDHKRPIYQTKTLYGAVSIVGEGRTSGTILIEDATDKTTRWIEVSLATGARTDLLPDEEWSEPIYDPDTGLLIGATLDDGDRNRFFDPAIQAKFDRAAAGSKVGRAELQALSKGGDWIVTQTTGPGDVGTWRLINGATGEVQLLGQSYPDIRPEQIAHSEWIDYAAGDGLKLRGVLTLPPGGKRTNLPVVVMPHGGPISHDRPGFDWWAQAFASRGYAVWQPNFRGSDGAGQDLIEAGIGEWGRKMQTDVSDGLAELARRGVADPKRACIVGGSYGGYAALAGVTLQHGVYRCAVSLAGVSDLGAMLKYEAERHGRVSDVYRFWKRLMNASGGSDPALAAISPARHADQADAPILLLHGDDDTIVPIAQSREMEAALKRAGKSVEFVALPHEVHTLDREATRQQMLKAAVEFVEKYDPAG